jgi:guanylate kinase
MKNNRIIIVGKGASGKDYLRKKFESRGFTFEPSYTTRPPREGEENGKDYFFISDEEGKQMIDDGMFYEYIYFNGWLYGTSVKQFMSGNLFIMTPTGILQIKPEDRKQSFIIYTDIDIQKRYDRLLNREMPGDTVQRRIEADELDFLSFNDYDLRVKNEDF